MAVMQVAVSGWIVRNEWQTASIIMVSLYAAQAMLVVTAFLSMLPLVDTNALRDVVYFSMAILTLIATVLLAVFCIQHFGTGLKPLLERRHIPADVWDDRAQSHESQTPRRARMVVD